MKKSRIENLKEEIGRSMKEGKNEITFIKAELLISEKKYSRGCEALGILLNVMLEKLDLLSSFSFKDLSKKEPRLLMYIAGIVFCTQHVDNRYIQPVVDGIKNKFGKEFVKLALKGDSKYVDQNLTSIFSPVRPSREAVIIELEKIAEENNIGVPTIDLDSRLAILEATDVSTSSTKPESSSPFTPSTTSSLPPFDTPLSFPASPSASPSSFPNSSTPAQSSSCAPSAPPMSRSSILDQGRFFPGGVVLGQDGSLPPRSFSQHPFDGESPYAPPGYYTPPRMPSASGSSFPSGPATMEDTQHQYTDDDNEDDLKIQ
ncbi:putative Regulator of Vps4 activity in the MVB pathway [Monocercomonoides exilis]|uniref:putative Regulator of Vps4 activity in the MVB pathway n=1 Tax=Monocercomonoides exilis TaxID=2049356 RepID=UPI00355A56D4|nr:putative Regulator of Vps4 activity in the MVB pathway [Monocercomonoides exilis]|eukprot:MONOS_1079.1-p1 / transcript=MONOS_1079.1 / gene=MONOS_1079 / organism=Monocercomonoides_exilis_PA203 / gene_product=unspecified product / transcript_product=unspecified product / location=Mono_scaffold00018:118000-119113(-) / protein_length=315 / sequence_SO=supercontig / SO=protein_coding / is_pseudo=false